MNLTHLFHLFHLLLFPAGNWNEDIARQEVAAKDYEVRRSKGDLLYLKKRRELGFLSQRVPHSFHSDGIVRFGDSIMVSTSPLSGHSLKYLCSNIFSQLMTPGFSRVTAGSSADPMARNVFVLNRAPNAAASSSKTDSNILKFGDRFVLSCNPSLVADLETGNLGLLHYLHSQTGSNVLGTTRNGRQEVSMCTRADAEAVWTVLHASGDRLLTDGEPVKAGDDIVLLHCMSNVMLAATENMTFPTEFGNELDVHCQTHKGVGVKSAKESGDIATSKAQGPNIFHISLAENETAAVDNRGFKPLSAEMLFEKARVLIASASGFHGIRSLALAVAALDGKGTGMVPKDAIKYILFEHGVTFKADEFDLMFSKFETSSNLIAATHLLHAIRSSGGAVFGAERVEAVASAYEHLESGGPVTAGRVKGGFDSKWDPRCRTLPKPLLMPAEALLEFQRQWPHQKSSSDLVSREQFLSYYADVSSCIASLSDFAEMVLNCWHVPGRGNWKQKKSMRVLVTLHKGSSTDATIPNGEDLDPDDFEGLCIALEKRCKITGVARIKILGYIDPN